MGKLPRGIHVPVDFYEQNILCIFWSMTCGTPTGRLLLVTAALCFPIKCALSQTVCALHRAPPQQPVGGASARETSEQSQGPHTSVPTAPTSHPKAGGTTVMGMGRVIASDLCCLKKTECSHCLQRESSFHLWAV